MIAYELMRENHMKTYENHMISFEIICNHMRLFQPGGFITKKENSILKFPDDSSEERTRHMPIDKKQDGSSYGVALKVMRRMELIKKMSPISNVCTDYKKFELFKNFLF